MVDELDFGGAGGLPEPAPGAQENGQPIVPEVFRGGGPIGAPGAPGSGGAFLAVPGIPPAPSAPLAPPEIFAAGEPIGGPASIFNIGGAPIAILGGVFRGGLPLGGPVAQIFRGGSAPMPPTLFIATISPSGPIGAFFIGSSGAPIGVETFGGGALPISPPEPVAVRIEAIAPRTALVTPPAIVFGQEAQIPLRGPIGEPAR
ncbi:MAG: hypothetical protein ACOY94_09650 [Bacillota bacterium]